MPRRAPCAGQRLFIRSRDGGPTLSVGLAAAVPPHPQRSPSSASPTPRETEARSVARTSSTVRAGGSNTRRKPTGGRPPTSCGWSSRAAAPAARPPAERRAWSPRPTRWPRCTRRAQRPATAAGGHGGDRRDEARARCPGGDAGAAAAAVEKGGSLKGPPRPREAWGTGGARKDQQLRRRRSGGRSRHRTSLAGRPRSWRQPAACLAAARAVAAAVAA